VAAASSVKVCAAARAGFRMMRPAAEMATVVGVVLPAQVVGGQPQVFGAGGAVLYALGWRESNRLNGAGGGASVTLSPGVGPGGWTSVALVGAY
jgi:hypothetical protein